MQDREKVIAALQHCAALKTCDKCPMSDDCKGIYNAAMAAAVELLKGQESVKPGVGGDQNPGGTWWYICPECQTAIDKGDLYCRHCGRPMKCDG